MTIQPISRTRSTRQYGNARDVQKRNTPQFTIGMITSAKNKSPSNKALIILPPVIIGLIIRPLKIPPTRALARTKPLCRRRRERILIRRPRLHSEKTRYKPYKLRNSLSNTSSLNARHRRSRSRFTKFRRTLARLERDSFIFTARRPRPTTARLYYGVEQRDISSLKPSPTIVIYSILLTVDGHCDISQRFFFFFLCLSTVVNKNTLILAA